MPQRGGRKRGRGGHSNFSGNGAGSMRRGNAGIGSFGGLFDFEQASHTGLGFSGASGGSSSAAISFVRGGSLEPHELLEPVVKDTLVPSEAATSLRDPQAIIQEEPEIPAIPKVKTKISTATVEATKSKGKGIATLTTETISVSNAVNADNTGNSSSEEICFVPRNKRNTPKVTKPQTPPKPSRKPTPQATSVPPPAFIPLENKAPAIEKDTRMKDGHEPEHDLDTIIQEYGGGKRTKKQARRDKARDKKTKKGSKKKLNAVGMNYATMGTNLEFNFRDEQDAIMEDYINNMSEGELEMLRGGPSNAKDDEDDSDEQEDVGRMEDLAQDSTDEESKGVVEQILSKRERPRGTQYLVRWKGLEVEDASWVLYESLDSKAQELVEAFDDMRLDHEISEANREREEIDNSTMEAIEVQEWIKEGEKAEQEDEKMEDGYETYEDEDDDEEHMIDTGLATFSIGERVVTKDGVTQITSTGDSDADLEADEEYLRLSKKAEDTAFGMYDDDTDSDEDLLLDDIFPNPNGEFPSASGMADYFEKHPLGEVPRRQKKGKKPNWNIDDPELLEKISNAWDADRQKKSDRKKEREALKAAPKLPPSLVNRKFKPNLHLLYPKGLNYDDVKNEIKEFLRSTMEILVFPPMDASQRRIIHLLADDLKLKSKSIGKDVGKTPGRAPVLQKKSDGFVISVHQADPIFHSNKYMTMVRHADRTTPGFAGSGAGFRGGRGAFEGRMRGREVSYRSTNAHPTDGHVVGGDAPAIGLQNKGRKMLEKMGYTEGTALGVQGNKGITQPIPAIVKKGRGGLG